MCLRRCPLWRVLPSHTRAPRPRGRADRPVRVRVGRSVSMRRSSTYTCQCGWISLSLLWSVDQETPHWQVQVQNLKYPSTSQLRAHETKNAAPGCGPQAATDWSMPTGLRTTYSCRNQPDCRIHPPASTTVTPGPLYPSPPQMYRNFKGVLHDVKACAFRRRFGRVAISGKCSE